MGEGVEVGAFASRGSGRGIGGRMRAARARGGRGPFQIRGAQCISSVSRVIGGDPQDYTFRGEHVELVAGDGNIFREHVTISRGTTKGGEMTRIGNDNFFLAYSHVGHDCQVGNRHAVCEWSDAGGARDRAGFCDDRSVFTGAPVLPAGAICLYRGMHGDHAGCAAVFADCDGTGDKVLRREHHWAGAQGIFGGADPGAAARVPVAGAVEEEHYASAGRDAQREILARADSADVQELSGIRGRRARKPRDREVASQRLAAGSRVVPKCLGHSICKQNRQRWGLIAGNGRFPFLVLEGARSQGIEMAVIALKEEASPELEKSAKRVHWVSLGELSKAIELMQRRE